MPKKNSTLTIPTRYLPLGSWRGLSADGKRRVWHINGKEYASKREYYESGDWKPTPEAPKASAADIMADEDFTEAGELPDEEDLQDAAVQEGTLDFDPVPEEG